MPSERPATLQIVQEVVCRLVHKVTKHLEHKSGETMQVDWAGQTAVLYSNGAELKYSR